MSVSATRICTHTYPHSVVLRPCVTKLLVLLSVPSECWDYLFMLLYTLKYCLFMTFFRASLGSQQH